MYIAMTTVITTNNNNVNCGTGNITCGAITCSDLATFNGKSPLTNNAACTYLNSTTIGSGSSGVSAQNFAILAYNRIGIVSGELDVWSDKRIKTNIQNITINSLETVRKLEPVKFNYIDVLKNNRDTIGFIAQDVFEVLPDATSKTTDIIPNIYDVGILNQPNIITLKTKQTSHFSFDSSPSKNIKIKVFVNNKDEFVYLDEIMDETTFRITEPITTEITDNYENAIFVYGQEVNDLMTIEKNAIFTFAVGAIKELDSELQETKATVKKLQEQIDFLISIK
jgi:hypothetical protein